MDVSGALALRVRDRMSRRRLERRSRPGARRGVAVAGDSRRGSTRPPCAAAFDVDESLSLLLDSRQLPRVVGLAPDGPVPPAGRRGADERRRDPRERASRRFTARRASRAATPNGRATSCASRRCSPCAATRCRSTPTSRTTTSPGSAPSQTLRFERAYQVVKHGDEWRAVREGRVPKEIRGEPRG